jgi:hypothetical protein
VGASRARAARSASLHRRAPSQPPCAHRVCSARACVVACGSCLTGMENASPLAAVGSQAGWTHGTTAEEALEPREYTQDALRADATACYASRAAAGLNCRAQRASQCSLFCPAGAHTGSSPPSPLPPAPCTGQRAMRRALLCRQTAGRSGHTGRCPAGDAARRIRQVGLALRGWDILGAGPWLWLRCSQSCHCSACFSCGACLWMHILTLRIADQAV